MLKKFMLSVCESLHDFWDLEVLRDGLKKKVNGIFHLRSGPSQPAPLIEKQKKSTWSKNASNHLK